MHAVDNIVRRVNFLYRNILGGNMAMIKNPIGSKKKSQEKPKKYAQDILYDSFALLINGIKPIIKFEKGIKNAIENIFIKNFFFSEQF